MTSFMLLLPTVPAPGNQPDKKEADVVEHLGVFRHVGLLANELPGTKLGCPLSSLPTTPALTGVEMHYDSDNDLIVQRGMSEAIRLSRRAPTGAPG